MDRNDPVLRLLPADEDLPRAFRVMNHEEQRWRAKQYLAAWVLSDGFSAMAWAYALQGEPQAVEDGRKLATSIDEDFLVDEVQRVMAEGKRP
jgi:hypothetical protein